jgi:hypothetical protein
MCLARLRPFVGIFGLMVLSSACLSGSRADAGFLTVSGDSNIVNALNGPDGIPMTAGNQTFFNNLRGGGSTVKILGTSLGSNVDGINQLAVTNTFYNGQSGVTSSIVLGPITASLLAGTNLFIDDLPDAALTAGEVTALKGFLAGGGSVFFIGEYGGFSQGTAANAAINSNLVALGSGMSLQGNFDLGVFTATTGNGQILSSTLSVGVSSFVYAAAGGVTGGQKIFLTSGLTTAFVAAEFQGRPSPSRRRS